MPASAIEVATIASKKIELEKRIRVDLEQLRGDLRELRERADNAVISAWQIGHSLIEAKKIIKHGDFQLWYETLGLNKTSVSRWIRLAEGFTLRDLPANKREAYLAIGLLPDKDRIDHEGNTSLAPSTHYLQFVNRWRNFFSQVEAGKKQFIVTDQVKQDLRPMYQWMKEIYGET